MFCGSIRPQKSKISIFGYRSYIVQRANELCGQSYQCKYDYAMTLNEGMAKQTLMFREEFISIQKTNQKIGKLIRNFTHKKPLLFLRANGTIHFNRGLTFLSHVLETLHKSLLFIFYIHVSLLLLTQWDLLFWDSW